MCWPGRSTPTRGCSKGGRNMQIRKKKAHSRGHGGASDHWQSHCKLHHSLLPDHGGGDFPAAHVACAHVLRFRRLQPAFVQGRSRCPRRQAHAGGLSADFPGRFRVDWLQEHHHLCRRNGGAWLCPERSGRLRPQPAHQGQGHHVWFPVCHHAVQRRYRAHLYGDEYPGALQAAGFPSFYWRQPRLST